VAVGVCFELGGFVDDGGGDEEIIAVEAQQADRVAPADQQCPRGDANFVVAF
jgi:hypothetical protein